MKKVALYSRVSTQEQRDKGLSVAAQRQALVKYCEDNGYTYYEEYPDEGVSAGALKKRKQMQRLLEDCRRGEIELILFTKLDRWFRHVDKYHDIQRELTQLNIPWKAIHEPMFETITAMGKGHINFYLSAAQIEVDKASERTKEIIRYKVSKGHALSGNLPLGYVVGEDKRPALDEHLSKVAKFILLEYQKVEGLKKVIELVHEKYGILLTSKVVSQTLKNKKYTGLYRGNPEYFPPLISMAQYDRNVELLKKNVRMRKTADGKNRVYMFSGILKCKGCGRSMSGAICGKGLHVYRCPKYRSNKSCSNSHITSEKLFEKWLLSVVKDELKNLQIQAEKMSKQTEELIDIEVIKEEQKRINKMYQKGRLDDDEYEAECDRLDNLLSQAIIQQPPPEVDLVFSPDFHEVYKTFTPEEKRKFWRSVLRRVDVFGREFTIV